MPDPGPTWRKSSASNLSDACVQVAAVDGDVLVRDSKDPAGPVLRFTLREWVAFLAGVRGGEFEPGRLGL